MSEDLPYNVETIIDNTVLCTWNVLKVYILSVLTTKQKKVTMWGDEFVN